MELLGGVVPNLYVALKMEPSADRSINKVGGRGGRLQERKYSISR